jgi:hypothetical protein
MQPGRFSGEPYLATAGWTAERLRKLRPLLDPPATLGIPPEQVVAVLGERDQYVPYAWAREMLDTWDVPGANRVVWDMRTRPPLPRDGGAGTHHGGPGTGPNGPSITTVGIATIRRDEDQAGRGDRLAQPDFM